LVSVLVIRHAVVSCAEAADPMATAATPAINASLIDFVILISPPRLDVGHF